MDDYKKELNSIMQNLEYLHYPSGPVYTTTQKLQALQCMEDNELEAIYHLVESHIPNLRNTATWQYEKALAPFNTTNIPLRKENFTFKCGTTNISKQIQNMLQQIQEMPEEWTVVQLTSQFNSKESYEVNPEKLYTNPLHIAVFNCGKNQILPFTVTVDQPTDKISGNDIEVRQEMHSIITDNVEVYTRIKPKLKKFMSYSDKEAYMKSRILLNSRLENLVKVMQNKWLGEWRCLLTGKFIDSEIEKLIMVEVDEMCNEMICIGKVEKTRSLLQYLIKGGHMLNITELKKALRFMFPEDQHKDFRISLAKTIQKLVKEYNIIQQARHPLILIIDEKIDCLPWEMIDILENHPVSRMPSLHFTYALFKEHEDTIENGWKISCQKGSYIVNPGLDLKNMEVRLTNFFSYWLPTWNGLVGVTPSADEFENMLTSNDIFAYSGHGSGTQFLPGERIQKLRVNAVVLLFGCSSVKLTSLGPQVEMYAPYLMYLIACSPCVIGMLWAVTDLETDTITTEFLSQWIPSEANNHWKLIDKDKWGRDGSLKCTNKKITLSKNQKHQPELLRVLCDARRAAKSYLIRAACVARGLPVKLQ